MVLSMSAISRRLRRLAAGLTMASIAAPSSATRTRAMSGADDRAKSTASAGESVSGAAPPTASRTSPTVAEVRAPVPRRAISVRWTRIGWLAPVRSALFMLDSGLRGNDLGPPTTTAWNVILPGRRSP